MNKEKIKELALAAGFKLKYQDDGSMDLNPYVYEFAEQLRAHDTELVLLRNLHQEVRGVNRHNGVDKDKFEDYFIGMIGSMHDVNDWINNADNN